MPLNAVLGGPPAVRRVAVIAALKLYDVTFLYLLCQFIAIPILGRSGGPRSRQARPGSDPTWFLGTYFWGYESAYSLASEWAGWDFTGETGSALTTVIEVMIDNYIIPGLGVFLVVLAASFIAESWARQQGLAARSRDAGVPPGVVATLLCIQFAWAGSVARALNR